MTGAAALALEVVYFRLVDGIMRSNSYTFAHVLTLYLILFGAGAAAAGRAGTPFAAARCDLPLDPVLDRRHQACSGVLLLLNMPSVFWNSRRTRAVLLRGEGYIYGLELPTDLRSTTALCPSRT